jgi:HlyD family secretion protein
LFCLALILLLAGALGWWIHRVNSRPPEVPFARVKRETLVSTLVTNGKVEPWEWVAVRAVRAGLVARVDVEKGRQVAKGALLVELDARDARAELDSANARVAQMQAELDTLRRGGKSVDLAEIDNDLARARMDLDVAQRDLAVLRRLAEKQAATRQNVDDASRRVEQLQAQMQALAKKRAALVSPLDISAAEARLGEAQAAQRVAEERLEQRMIRAPVAGTVYQLDARVGAYLNPGDLVANVGVLDKLRVRVYVDEPELGRVAPGMPVTLTWDALPGRQWKGKVDRMPTEVVPLGTRQVGEVICALDNPNRELLPGTNVNAEILSQVVNNALIVPKEAVRTASSQAGVFVLSGQQVRWRPVKLGASSVTRVQVLDGLLEGEAVALGAERPLADGDPVRPVFLTP